MGHKERNSYSIKVSPWEGVLSPILFILFINDIVKDLPMRVKAALYADDLVL